MYRAAAQSSARIVRAAGRSSAFTGSSRRFLSTAPPATRRGTWKGSALRWGLAIGAVYWYNTSPIFADEPVPRTIPPPPQFDDSDLPTVDAIVEEKRKQAELRAQKAAPPPPPPQASDVSAFVTHEEGGPAQTPEQLEEEANQQGAFNPETGEINWDCPCLGGMADGPCGEEFKSAFSCFVHSTEEVKGVDCIDKFQHMQDCFRQYPEIYGSELADDEEGDAAAPVEGAADDGEPPKDLPKESATTLDDVQAITKTTAAEPTDSTLIAAEPATAPAAKPVEKAAEKAAEKVIEDAKHIPVSAEDTMTPRKAFDATDANNKKNES